MIEITPSLFIDENEIQLDFIRSSGPGGQNVNKVATGVQLRFNVNTTTALPEEVKSRLRRLAGSRITDDGVLIIDAKRFRTQEHNREDAIHRLIALVQKALEVPKPRRKTRPTLASQVERIEGKKRRGAIKKSRQVSSHEYD